MKNSIIAFLSGALAALLLFLKFKKPDIVKVEGDLIESQKVKDNSKHKLSRKEVRSKKKKARILRREQKRLN